MTPCDLVDVQRIGRANPAEPYLPQPDLPLPLLQRIMNTNQKSQLLFLVVFIEHVVVLGFKPVHTVKVTVIAVHDVFLYDGLDDP